MAVRGHVNIRGRRQVTSLPTPHIDLALYLRTDPFTLSTHNMYPDQHISIQ